MKKLLGMVALVTLITAETFSFAAKACTIRRLSTQPVGTNAGPLVRPHHALKFSYFADGSVEHGRGIRAL